MTVHEYFQFLEELAELLGPNKSTRKASVFTQMKL